MGPSFPSLPPLILRLFVDSFPSPLGARSLKSWFLYNGQEPEDEIPLPPARQPKHCPSCRGPVRAAPTPVFLVKDLVHSIGPTLRVLDGEDPSRSAPRDVSTDRDVWAGLFEGREAGLGRPLPVWDDSDGAWRCPKCFAEVADGECVSPAGRAPAAHSSANYPWPRLTTGRPCGTQTGCGELYDDPGAANNAGLEDSSGSEDGSNSEANVSASEEDDSEMDDFINDGDDDDGDERADVHPFKPHPPLSLTTLTSAPRFPDSPSRSLKCCSHRGPPST